VRRSWQKPRPDPNPGLQSKEKTLMLRYAAIAALVLLPTFASAKTFPVPDENPVATVTIPDSWEPKDYEGGVNATSPDGKVYIAAEVAEADELKQAVKDGIEWFDKQGVDIDANSMTTKEGKEAGADSFEMDFTGKDKDGPTAISMELVHTNKAKKFLILYFWGAPDDAKANAGELKKISDSLQLTK
jgi:hypothetical protein